MLQKNRICYSVFILLMLCLADGLRIKVIKDFLPGEVEEENIASACVGLQPEYRSFCNTHSEVERRKSTTMYKNVRSQCLLSSSVEPNIDFEGYLWPTTASFQQVFRSDGPQIQSSENITKNLYLEKCKLQTTHDASWQIYRVGPFSTFGGESWSDAQVNDIFAGSEFNGAFITTSFMGPVNRDGEVLGYPPLHVHHMHLQNHYQGSAHRTRSGHQSIIWNSASELILDIYAFHTHGDSQCQSSAGGTNCYVMNLPLGYGIWYKPNMTFFLNGQVIDERLPKSSELEWWMEWGFSISTQPNLKAISKLFLSGGPSSLQRTQASFSAASFLLPKEDAVFFFSALMHQSGRFLYEGAPLSHAHQQYNKGHWALSATPEEAGLRDDLFTPIRKGSPLFLKKNNITFKHVQEHILQALAQSRLACLHSACSHTPMVRCDAGTGLEYVPGTKEHSGRYYDRQFVTTCSKTDWYFNAGDAVTIVWFLGPVNPSDPYVPEVYPMHLSFGAYILNDANVQYPDLSHYTSNWRYHGAADPSHAIRQGTSGRL